MEEIKFTFGNVDEASWKMHFILNQKSLVLSNKLYSFEEVGYDDVIGECAKQQLLITFFKSHRMFT